MSSNEEPDTFVALDGNRYPVNEEQSPSGVAIEFLDSRVTGSSGPTPRPWEICGATIIWSPTGRSNVAAVSDPRPESNTSVGYYEIRPWSEGGDAETRFQEACANAELIVRCVNEFDEVVRQRDMLQQTLETRAQREMEMLEGVARENDALVAALLPIAKAYPDDPGTSDLYDEQPVSIKLGDVRRVWSALREAANVRLIAAAPALYNALTKLTHAVKALDYNAFSGSLDDAENALALARGDVAARETGTTTAE